MFVARLAPSIRKAMPLVAGLVLLQAFFPPGAALGASTRHHAQFTQPWRLVLTLPDVTRVYGPGFRVMVHQPVTNRYLGAQLASMFNQDGRITGYANVFGRVSLAQVPPASQGINAVVSFVSAYNNVNGPRRELHLPMMTVTVPNARRSPLFGIGNEAILTTYTRVNGKARTFGAAVTFRRRTYLASVNVTSSTRFDNSSVVSLARILDQRIQNRG